MKMLALLAVVMIFGFAAWGSSYGGYGHFHAYSYPQRPMIVSYLSYYSVNVWTPYQPVFYAPRTTFHASFTPSFGSSYIYSSGSRPGIVFIDP